MSVPSPSAAPLSPSSPRAMLVRRLLALALAAGSGLGSNARMLRGKLDGPHGWELLTRDVEPLVPAVAPSSVVGVLVQGGAGAAKDAEMIGVTQYAFTPVRVRGIPWEDCARSGAESCGLTAVDHLIVGARSPEELQAWGAQLGFALTATSGRYALLSRPGRRP